jgi:recombination protein RecT
MKQQNENTALAVNEKAPKDMSVHELVNSNYLMSQVSKTLPGLFTPERFMRVCLTSFNRNPKLWDCSKESVAQVILSCAQMGLEPDGRHAHIIPYGNTAQLQLDYKGLVTLVRRSGEVSKLHADIVCEKDVFEENLGVILKHIPNRKENRGETILVYAMAELKDGSQQSVVMSVSEVEAIRKRSKSGTSGPWVTDWNEMAKKTAFKRLTKWLPLSYEAVEAIEQENQREFGQTVNIEAQPASTKTINDKLAKKSKKDKPQEVVQDAIPVDTEETPPQIDEGF